MLSGSGVPLTARVARSFRGVARKGGVGGLVGDLSNNLTVLADCDGLKIGNVDLTPRRARGSACVLKLSPDGELMWARLLEGELIPQAITSDASGHTWVIGDYRNQVWLEDQLLPDDETNGGKLLRLSPLKFASQEVEHQRGDLVAFVFEGEVAGVEQVKLRVG